MSDDEHSLDSAVPLQVAQTRPKSSEEPAKLSDFDFEDMKHKLVEVRASGYRYTGTLIGADDRDLYLKGLTRWWVLPLERVSEVRLLPETPPEQRDARRKGPIPGDPDPGVDGAPVVESDGEPLPGDGDS